MKIYVTFYSEMGEAIMDKAFASETKARAYVQDMNRQSSNEYFHEVLEVEE